MTDRIQALWELTMSGKMFVETVKTDYDPMDLFLNEEDKNVKRICEYIENQRPHITKYSAFTGFFRFDGSVVGDVFGRTGHPHTDILMEHFFTRRLERLSALDWQHGTSDYREVLRVGISGIIDKIDRFIPVQEDEERRLFLLRLRKVAESLVCWVEKCAREASAHIALVEEAEYKKNFERLSKALLHIAKHPPSDFYEAVLCIYVCFSMNPDSFGTLDRYLTEFYRNDIAKGCLTREEAKAYLQEMMLMVQAATPFTSPNFTKGGQSHFCIGGRDENGQDFYNEVSELIVESLMELDTHIPEITFRWTSDTPKETFRYLLLCERNDKNKRLAFTNDDKRLKAYTEICGIPYHEAVNYTMVGCNEPAMLGGMCASTSHANLAHAIEYVLHHRADEILSLESFDDFYRVLKDQLYADLDKIYHYDDLFIGERAKDINYVSCLFANGCIENGKSMTQGGVNYAVSAIMFLGNVTLIDSLSIIKQFVYDEKLFSMQELLNALRANWQGYEDMRALILKKGAFFGNDDAISNEVAKRVYEDFYLYVKDKKNVLGYPVLLGDHTGYKMYFKWFGDELCATPDGRCDGDPVSYGITQTHGKAREGLTALMNAIAAFDPHGISSATVTNFTLDDSYVRDDERFEKTVDMLETFFKNGGIQFQLNHVSRDMLLRAKACPEEATHLRVRVTGYSDFFTRLEDPIQDSIIKRYE